jgi:hypothetical protein
MKHDITAFMRPQDIEAFRAAAMHFHVYIAVRRTNPASLDYIGKAGYVAKRLDCKAKTADQDCMVEGALRKLAGLVVDPHRVGPAAYKPGKYDKALKEWEKFRPLLAPDMLGAGGARSYVYMPAGKLYAVQLDRAHEHYGCVMFSSSSLLSAAKYIHGDYDLMAVVPESDVQSNVFVTEERLGQAHARSKERAALRQPPDRQADGAARRAGALQRRPQGRHRRVLPRRQQQGPSRRAQRAAPLRDGLPGPQAPRQELAADHLRRRAVAEGVARARRVRRWPR